MKWYRIENKGDKAEIWLYEMIGEDFWSGEGMTAKKFQKELAAIKTKQIDLHINSPGGSVFDGITIYNLIKQHPANVTTYIDGLAASIASVIALAGDHIIMAGNAMYMVHSPMGGVYGNAVEMRSFADVLDKIRGTMVTSYAAKSGRTEEEIAALLDAETWMSAEEAKEFGFVDEISGQLDMAACARFIPVMAKAGFKHIPEFNAKTQPSEREIERALREAGCTRSLARIILARGFPEDLREADTESEITVVVEVQREAESLKPTSIDAVAALLAKAELAAPSRTSNQEG